MAQNKGYLTADRTATADEQYTPYYAVEPILKYISKTKKVWCPFDCEWSAFYQTLKQNGYNVERSTIQDGQDFFTYEPTNYDVIISNPPFTKKDEVLKRLYELNKPFAILLPLNSLQGVTRYELFKQDIQILAFDKRIAFHNAGSMQEYKKGVAFASAYFCKGILPKDLILEQLNEYKKELRPKESEVKNG